MPGLLRFVPTYSRVAMGFVVLCIAGLYALVLTGRPSEAYAPVPPVARQAEEIARAAPTLRKSTSVLLVSSARKLVDLFERIGYRLEDVRQRGAVPRLFLTHFPGDLPNLRPASDLKAVFIRAMLPLILRANERILAERVRIESLGEQVAAGVPPGAEDLAWLEAIARRYRASGAAPSVLLRYVDIVPPSLALAQGAEESGWGTSRFAREGNALYGQRVYRGSGGIVPFGRNAGEVHRVRAFDRLLDGVESYMRNLNSHPAYDRLRVARAAMRAENRPLDGHALAGALTRYSERGPDYVESLQVIIRANALWTYDKARLDELAPEPAVGSGT